MHCLCLGFAGPVKAKELQAFALSAFPDNVMRVTSATYQQFFRLTPGPKVWPSYRQRIQPASCIAMCMIMHQQQKLHQPIRRPAKEAHPPSCSQVILFTNKPQSPPLFRALANNLRGLGLAFVDIHESDTELMKQVKVPKVSLRSLLTVPHF